MAKKKKNASPSGGNKNKKPNKANAQSLKETILGWILPSNNDFVKTKFKYLVIFAVILIAAMMLYNSVVYEQNLMAGVNRFESKIASFFLNIFGFGTSVTGETLSGSGSSVSVERGCDGMEPLLLYVITVLLVPLHYKTKIPGLLVGISVLFVINLIRIMGLFIASVHFPAAFDFLHVYGGYFLFTSITIVMWLMWFSWAFKKNQEYAVA